MLQHTSSRALALRSGFGEWRRDRQINRNGKWKRGQQGEGGGGRGSQVAVRSLEGSRTGLPDAWLPTSCCEKVLVQVTVMPNCVGARVKL